MVVYTFLLALGRQRQSGDLCEFEVSLLYKVLGQPGLLHRETCLETPLTQKKRMAAGWPPCFEGGGIPPVQLLTRRTTAHTQTSEEERAEADKSEIS